MTYQELVTNVKEAFSKAKADMIGEHVAVEVNIMGEAEGAFYLEIKLGKIYVEPYEYYDRDAKITTTAVVALDLARGNISFEDAYNNGRIHVRGNFDKVYLLDEIKR